MNMHHASYGYPSEPGWKTLCNLSTEEFWRTDSIFTTYKDKDLHRWISWFLFNYEDPKTGPLEFTPCSDCVNSNTFQMLLLASQL